VGLRQSLSLLCSQDCLATGTECGRMLIAVLLMQQPLDAVYA
jgi:hypothetical protein